MSYSLQQCYDWFSHGYAWADEAEHCPCHGSGWALSNVDTWHCCPIHHTNQIHPEEYNAYLDTLAWWEEEKKKPVFITEPIWIGPKPKRRHITKDDLPF